MNDDLYILKGYRSRRHYLQTLVEKHEVNIQNVISIANHLGPAEDFNKLVETLKVLALTKEKKQCLNGTRS